MILLISGRALPSRPSFLSMNRLRLVGGHFSIESESSKGTRIHARIPRIAAHFNAKPAMRQKAPSPDPRNAQS